MDFENATPLPVALYRSQLNYRDLMLATVVAKASFEVAPDGALRLVPDPLPIYEADVETPLGTIEGDVVPVKEGCDFAIYGHATSRQPVPTMNVSVRVGTFTRILRVTGDRIWADKERAPAGIEGTPFASMPLDYSRAFGGSAMQPTGEKSPHPDNPGGRGWIVVAESAAGTPLPNVEEDDQPVTHWDQQPLPASLLPLPRASCLRGSRGVLVDLEEGRTSMKPLAFNFSHPRMHLPAFPAGEVLTVQGLTSEPSWNFMVPAMDLSASLVLGAKRYEVPLVPDTLCVVPAHRRLWTVFRRAFVYQFLAERKRLIRVHAGRASDSDNASTTIAAEMSRPNPSVPIAPPDEPERMPLPWALLRDSHPLTSIIESFPLFPSG